MKIVRRNRKQINIDSLTLKNQEVMKTKKYSISLKALAAVVFAFSFSAIINAQFISPAPAFNTQTGEEVRAATAVTYSLAGHVADDTYRWVVVGGVITGGAGTGVAPDSSVLDWTADAFSIEVTWDTDITGTPVGSAPGEIIVQKRLGGDCTSELQVLDITMWNPATANLDVTGLTTDMCAGELLGGNLPVDLTGAPDLVADGFSITYTVAATGGITDLGGIPLDGTGATIPNNDEQALIALPAGILNASGSDQTLTYTLTAMNDDFAGPGALGLTTTYQITVHPIPSTGDIISDPTGLIRRL